MRVIVIGGVAAGMSAASKLKRIRKDWEVMVYEKGGYLSYGACGLPYYISGEIPDHESLIARTPEAFKKSGIDCYLYHEVLKVNPDAKTIEVKNLETGEEKKESYDKLMIASGAVSIIPPFPGRDLKNVEVLKTMEDGLRLKEKLTSANIKKVTIIGGGPIGVEMAETAINLGIDTKLIQLSDKILTPFDPEITSMAEEELIRKGVDLKCSEKVESFHGKEKVEQVQTDKGIYETDLVLIAVGVKPELSFLDGVAIQRSENGALVVDREMRTSIPDIYAAGDCAQMYHIGKQENDYIALWTTANKMGRLAGENLAGGRVKYRGSLGSAAIRIFDLELGRTGLSEQEAIDLRIDYDKVVVDAKSNAGYCPDARPLRIKVIFEKRSRKLLGAQAIGEKGAVLRVDVFSVAIQAGMTTEELGYADLCYAPPFAGVWDAINVACNVVK